MTHPQIEVLYDGYQISVDEDMVDLLQLIWKEGYKTNNSCQDINEGKVWIHFESVDDFHDILQKAYTYDLRLNKSLCEDTLWQFFQDNVSNEINIDDNGHPDEDDDLWIPGSKVLLSVSIRFDKELKDDFTKLWTKTFQPCKTVTKRVAKNQNHYHNGITNES